MRSACEIQAYRRSLAKDHLRRHEDWGALRGRTVLATEFDSNLMWLFAGSVLKLQWSIQLPLSGLSKLSRQKLSEFLSLLFSFNGLPPRPSLAEFLALVCSITGYPVDQPTLESSLTNLSVGYQEVDTCSCAPVHAPGQLTS